MPLPLRLYLVRHGETDWSLSGRYTGRSDISLTTQGEDDVRRLGQHLRQTQFSYEFTSPMKRALRTGELVQLGAQRRIDPDLSEWNYGDYEGRTPAEISKMSPNWNLYRDGTPHGETPVEISVRADRLLARLRALSGNVALFSHGHFGRVLAARWIGLPVDMAQHFLLGTASISILAYEHDRKDQPAISLWNSTT